MERGREWIRWSLRAEARDWKRLVGLALLVVGAVFALATVTAVKVTEQPSFCRSCHIMEPYYQSWATSAHKDVACIDCHYEPGLRSTISGKFQGIRQVVVYFTGGAGTRPWAEIDDASCLRSGCHDTQLLNGKVDFNGVHFEHRPHLTEMRRGKKLRCTSCHSQIVQGSHVTVTTSTCILCHFKDQPRGEPIGGCRACHDVPVDTITLPGGLAYRHENYVGKGVDCISCHATLTAGDGFVPRSRCTVCHNIPIDTYLAQPEFLHRKHVTEHKVECTDCHEEMTHGYDSARRRARLDCASCHEGTHDATVHLAEGDGGLTSDSRPHVGPMLAARVECVSCHIRPVGNDTTHAGLTRVGDARACASCHGAAGPRVLDRWDDYFRVRIPEVEAALRASRAPRELRERARHLLETVRVGRPVHNPALARDLLDAAVRLARGESVEVRRPVAEAGGAVGLDCSYCHLEGPRAPIRFQGANFLHLPHTRDLGIDCRLCHEDAPSAFPQGRHGRVRLSIGDCQACHHRQTERCAACHGAGPSGELAWRGRTFPHGRHSAKGVPCAACHRGSSGAARMTASVTPAQCASCHHREGNVSSCGDCHGEGPEAPAGPQGFPHRRHAPLGISCTDCHASGAPERVENPPCATCHEDGIPAPGEEAVAPAPAADSAVASETTP